MKTSKVYTLAMAMFVVIFILSACSGGQADSQPIDEPVAEPVIEPTVEQVPEPTAEPTAEPTPVPEIEPEIIDLGYDARLLVRGLPDDIVLDANIDIEMKENMPDSYVYDYVQTEVVLINISKDGAQATLDKGVVELCYTTTSSKANLSQPMPYYWDTSISPMVDGRGLRVSTQEKVPDQDPDQGPQLVVCAMIQNSGAYAIVAP